MAATYPDRLISLVFIALIMFAEIPVYVIFSHQLPSPFS
jgi:hypothetical protein